MKKQSPVLPKSRIKLASRLIRNSWIQCSAVLKYQPYRNYSMKKGMPFLILFMVNLLSAFKTLSNVSKDCVIRGSVVSGHCSPLFSIHASYTSFSCDGPYVKKKKNRQVNNRIICLVRWSTFAKYKHRNTHTNAKIFHFGLRCRWG